MSKDYISDKSTSDYYSYGELAGYPYNGGGDPTNLKPGQLVTTNVAMAQKSSQNLTVPQSIYKIIDPETKTTKLLVGVPVKTEYNWEETDVQKQRIKSKSVSSDITNIDDGKQRYSFGDYCTLDGCN